MPTATARLVHTKTVSTSLFLPLAPNLARNTHQWAMHFQSKLCKHVLFGRRTSTPFVLTCSKNAVKILPQIRMIEPDWYALLDTKGKWTRVLVSIEGQCAIIPRDCAHLHWNKMAVFLKMPRYIVGQFFSVYSIWHPLAFWDVSLSSSPSSVPPLQAMPCPWILVPSTRDRAQISWATLAYSSKATIKEFTFT